MTEPAPAPANNPIPAPTPHDFSFDRADFRASFTEKLQPLIIDEWSLTEGAVAATGGDPDLVVALVAAETDLSKALIRKQLTELVAVAGARPRGIEARLHSLISKLEGATAPVQERAAQTRDAINERAARTQEALGERAAQTREALRELSEQGQHVIDEVRQVVPQAEEKVKENLWTALLAALGLGLLMGLVVGLSRGR